MTDKQMLDVYRHDAHKMRGRSHAAGETTIQGVVVNKSVPYGADGDASALSRPNGKPNTTMEDEQTHYRMSMLKGDTRYDSDSFSLQSKQGELHSLLAIDDAQRMHRNWLESRVVSAFNESTHYPYTSLKYHTLLVAALTDCYRNNIGFSELYLVVDGANEIVTHRTIYSGDRFSLRLSATADGECANIPSTPFRSWAGTWSRLTDHPLETDHDKFDMMLDANLRRISAWSTALQYLEDYEQTNWVAAK